MTPLSIKMTRWETSRANLLVGYDDHGSSLWAKSCIILRTLLDHFRSRADVGSSKRMASDSWRARRATRCLTSWELLRFLLASNVPIPQLRDSLWRIFSASEGHVEYNVWQRSWLFKDIQIFKRDWKIKKNHTEFFHDNGWGYSLFLRHFLSDENLSSVGTSSNTERRKLIFHLLSHRWWK